MLSGLKGMLFDFDGTLAPNLDLPDMRRQVVALTAAEGVPEQVYAGCYIVEIIEAASEYLSGKDQIGAQDYSERAHQLIRDFELEAATRTDVFPEVPALLDGLAAMGLPSAIVTRNCADAVTLTFPTWAQHARALFARDQVPRLKPDPHHFETALAAIGCAPEATAIISDGAMDMRTGTALKQRCIGVLTGSSDEHTLRHAGAHHVVPHVRDLLTAGF